MSFLSAIGGIFSPDKLIDKVSRGVDKLVYTDEEKSNTFERMLRLYEPFKIAQRYISLALLFLLGSSWFIALAVRLLGNMFGTPIEVDGETFMWWMEDSKWIAVNAISMFGEPFFYSVVFYFGGGAGEGVVRGMMEGKVKRLTR